MALFSLFAALLISSHAPLLRLPYFWDEAGYYIPAARDLLAGSLIPVSTPSNAHPPLVMAWLALSWKIVGQHILVTRCAMLLLAAFSLLGFFRLAQAASNSIVAAASTFLTAIYPVFFAQSSLAQVDLAAAGLTFWGLEAYVRRQNWTTVLWFSLAALTKETAILIPIALVVWEAVRAVWQSRAPGSNRAKVASRHSVDAPKGLPSRAINLLVPIVPLALWYLYHYAHTGVVFGNPEYFRYNVRENLYPLRIFLALLLRTWQAIGYMNLYVLTLACCVAMRYPPLPLDRPPRRNPSTISWQGARPRIDVDTQLAFLTVAGVYILALSVIGGAVLARYMLPVTPLMILICVSTVWRRLRAWKAVMAIVGLGFITALFVNPPYGFSPEDNLAYRDYIHLHQDAEAFIKEHYPRARVLTAWPASDELSRPYLGYVSNPVKVVRIEDFTAEQLLAAADARSRFEVALVFSTKYQPPRSFVDHWRRWQEWKSRYFGYHVDIPPEAAASVLGGELVYVRRLRGQWVGIVELHKVEEADLQRQDLVEVR